MDQLPITCEMVDQRELDRRYVAGQLDDTEAAAFEEHYFGCDRCWNLVKGGAGVRAALATSAVAEAPRRGAWRRPLAIAAGLGVILLGTWQLVGSGNGANPVAIRGSQDSIAVASELSAGFWRAAWSSVEGAASYRVRVFTPDGRLIITRESTDTAVRLPADSLSALARGDVLYLEVQGFDLMRRPVARSPLTPLPAPAAPR